MRLRDWVRFTIHQYRGSSLAASIAIERLLKEGPWFDEAVERMLDAEWERGAGRFGWTESERLEWREEVRPDMVVLFRAAVGGTYNE